MQRRHWCAMAAALYCAHGQDLLHRGVQSAHRADRGEQWILLGDFGIARRLGEVSGLTVTNVVVNPAAKGPYLLRSP